MGSAFVLGSFVAAGTFRVDRLPRPGESLLASAVAWEAGGKGFNVAAGLSRLGVEVDGLIPVGTDHLAALAEPALVRMGLPASMIRVHPGPTGIGVGFVGADGENCLAVHPGANLLLSRETVRAATARIASAAMVLAQQRLAHDHLVPFHDVSTYRQTVDRRGLDRGQLAQPAHRHLQGARDGRGGERQDVNVVA
jgi:ribokinase